MKKHKHRWEDSTKEQCPFCDGDTYFCAGVSCYLYKCKKCEQTFDIRNP